MGCLILLSMLIKGALKHHTYGKFKQHIGGSFYTVEFECLISSSYYQRVQDNEAKKK